MNKSIKKSALHEIIFNNNRRDGVVVRKSASQLVDMGFISQVESYQKTLKQMVFTASLLGVQHIGIVWRASQQAFLLFPWARHLTACLRLYVAGRWWGSWWPRLTKYMQTEHELIRVNK